MDDEMKERLEERKDALAIQEREAEHAPGETIATYIERQKPAILAALPRNVDVDRFARIVLTNVRTNPNLLTCNPMSLLAAVMQSAQLGLEPGSGLGEAYLIPYGGEVQFQIGYRGTTKLARNSGDVSMIEARAVYVGDHYLVVLGTDPRIEHIPSRDALRDWEHMTDVYAVATMKDGSKQFDTMTKVEVEAHRDRYSKGLYKKGGKTKSDSPWWDELGGVEMAKKTVVIRMAKMLPLSAEASQAFAADGTVRHELAREMSLIPDVEAEPLPATALGAVPTDAIDASDAEPESPTQPDTAPESEEPRSLSYVCEGCGHEGEFAPDISATDVYSGALVCDECQKQLTPKEVKGDA